MKSDSATAIAGYVARGLWRYEPVVSPATKREDRDE